MSEAGCSPTEEAGWPSGVEMQEPGLGEVGMVEGKQELNSRKLED